MYLHCNEGSHKTASTSFADLRIPSSAHAFSLGRVFGANMVSAQYFGFKAIDSLIFDNVVRALQLKW